MGVQWEIDFDYQKFEEILYEACLEAFSEVQEKRKDETFYTFSLTTSHIFETVSIAVNTEESLLKSATQYHKKYNEKMGISLNDIKLYLRYQYFKYPWSTNDEVFGKANQILGDFGTQCQDMMEHNDAYIHEEGCISISRFLDSKIERIFLRVINRLDVLHIFEKTNSRSNITLHLSKGDFESVIYDPTFNMINPSDVYIRFQKECTHMNKLGQLISAGYYRK